MDDTSFMSQSDATKFEEAVKGCCKWCRALSIKIFIAQRCMEFKTSPWHRKISTEGKDPPTIDPMRNFGGWQIGEISPSAFRHDCSLCEQFSLAFKLFSTPSTGSLTSHVLERDGGREDRYFTLSDNSNSWGVFLLPLFSRWHNPDGTRPCIGKEIKSDLPDFGQVKASLRHCRLVHRKTCMRTVLQKTAIYASGLCVVDCVSRRLVKISQDVPYICLSYVWGSFQAEEPTSDGKLPVHIPKTIEDALFVAICLEIPYLWVDCYCINQNNIQEKHNIIRAMDKIYRGAELTIIAIVGVDPHHGLPGVRETPRRPQYKITMVGETYVAAEDVIGEVTNSTWSSRGWTYQEMTLSRRRLVFTTSQMYYQCWESIHLESISFDVTATYLDKLYRVFPQTGVGDTLEDLQQRLSEYHQRQLSYHSDTVDAFQGIINAFHVSESPSVFVTQFYGILVLSEYNRDELDMARTSFLVGLGWLVRPDSFSSSDVFPSWTWASTTVGGSSNGFRKLNYRSIIPRSGYRRHEGIEVTLSCRRESGQVQSYSITKYPSYDGDYKDFWPWFDITTWSQQCEVKLVSSTTGTVDIHGATRTIYDPLALQLGQVHAVCTETTGEIWSQTAMLQVKGLLVVEVVPGEYRRVGLFYTHLNPRTCRSSDQARKELDRVFPPEPEWDEQEGRDWLTECGGIAPFVLEDFPGSLWRRRTMRLI